MKSIITLAATITLAITLTLTACEEKKKQDGTTTTAPEPSAEAATPQPATQEAVAEKPAEKGGGSFTDERDGKTYKTVKIGEQVWMAENLNYNVEVSSCYGEGDLEEIGFDPEANDGNGWPIYGGPKYTPAEIQAYCDKYGRLYDWETAMKACPKGWHLPDTTEWKVLITAVGGEKTAGKYLKSTSGWDKNGNGEDKFGFSALPGGKRGDSDGDDGSSYFVGDRGEWWTSSESDNWYAIHYIIGSDYEYVEISDYGKVSLKSIRCIQN